MTPNEIATVDQYQAEAGAVVDILCLAIRKGDELHGEAQGLADNIAFLRSDFSPSFLAAMVVVAVRRIPDDTGTGEPS